MSLNDTPSGERLHIGFFGRRNVGKSSLVNAVTDQDLAVVSPTKGTTTDPVRKAMELLPIGPVLIIDTPGYDDEGELGELRVRKMRQILNRTDIAVLVTDHLTGITPQDQELLRIFEEKKLPWLVVFNKEDLVEDRIKENMAAFWDSSDLAAGHKEAAMSVSALHRSGIWELKEKIALFGKAQEETRSLVRDLISPGDTVVLVIPIDESAPKGRLILPQQQVIRDILEADAAAVCVREDQLSQALSVLTCPPALVITDSQVFERVAKEVPGEIALTSFSILMARYKGFLDAAYTGVKTLDRLEDGDRILIAEGCTHHRQCEDIGTVKIPNWIRQHTGKEIEIVTSSGRDFPEDLSGFRLVIHCGGCMLGEREVRFRMKCAADQGIPVTNYGLAIAYMKGILERSMEPCHRS